MSDNNELRYQHIIAAFNKYVEITGKNYRLGKELGRGAFGSVFEVTDGSGRTIVMKGVDSSIVDARVSAKEVVKYTRAEIQNMLTCKDCPYVMDLIDYSEGIIDEEKNKIVFLLFMPKMEVSTRYFQRLDYPIDAVLDMTKDICKALDFCAEHKILHRDVKPENVYYSPEKGHFVLADFGVSRSLFDPGRSVTAIGSYLAPEIVRQMDLHGRFNSDVYSLGVSAILLIAKMGADGSVAAERLKMLRADVHAVLDKAMLGDPAERYQTAAEFLHDLERVRPDNGRRANNGGASAEVSKPALQCFFAFFNHDLQRALSIAEEGYRAGSAEMSCMYAYILACKQDYKKALEILEPLKKRDAVALGLYGIIGRDSIHNKFNSSFEDQKMINMIEQSARKGYSAAMHFIGRWKYEGVSGFTQDKEEGLAYIIGAHNKNFLPATDYLLRRMQRDKNFFKNVENHIRLLELQLEGFTRENYPDELLRSIMSAY